jgi:arylsulfatase A-like enzyme
MATMMDIFPTFAKLSGAKVPTDRIIDGKDIRPLMMGERNAASPYEVFFFYRADRLQAVRSGKWKLILPHVDQMTKEDVPLALYDLKADIGEQNDLSAKYPSIVKRLQTLADRCREDLGDAVTGVKGKNRRPCGEVG